jgi:hypothetical protein
LSFKNTRELFKIIDKELAEFAGPKWHTTEVAIGDALNDKHILHYRDIEEVGDYLMGLPPLSGQLLFTPVKMKEEDNTTDVYEEMCSGTAWNELQVYLGFYFSYYATDRLTKYNQPCIPVGTTLGGVIFTSDKTRLTMHTGDVAAHGLYMLLANINKSVRSQDSHNTWLLIAYAPTSKWRLMMLHCEHLSKTAKTELMGILNRQLFHRCLSIITRPLRCIVPHDVVDLDGNIRSVLYVLMTYIADLEEQLWIAAIGSRCCPHCLARGSDLGNEDCKHVRTSESILADIQAVLDILTKKFGENATALEFLEVGRNYGLCGVKKLFWVDLPGVDICKVLCPDLLHGFYKCFYNHVFHWNLAGLKADELDAQMRSQIQLAGD